MLMPRYVFSNDFLPFQDYFLASPHRVRHFHIGDRLWRAGAPHEEIHYILEGIEMHYALHENGHRKIISFHGAGTVFPGYHQLDFKIERSLVTEALTEMTVLAFTRDQFKQMFESNASLAEAVVNWYAAYVNRLLFEAVHQEYNTSFLRLCNLLYLFAANTPAPESAVLPFTQDTLAELLSLSRVQLTRALARLRQEGIIATQRGALHIVDLNALAAYCSSETLDD